MNTEKFIFWYLSFSKFLLFKTSCLWTTLLISLCACGRVFLKQTLVSGKLLEGLLQDSPGLSTMRRWLRSKMGRSPASRQIHKKLIKIYSNSYKAISRWQQKTPGLQRDRLSSLKWGRREKGAKREKTEDFWAGTCAPEEGGSHETEVPMHRETPSQIGPKGSYEVLENQVLLLLLLLSCFIHVRLCATP